MTQDQLDRHVARRTGESVRTIAHLGFSALPDDRPADPRPGTLFLAIDCPRCRRLALYPGRRRDGTCRPAHCQACAMPFTFDLGDVRVTASLRA